MEWQTPAAATPLRGRSSGGKYQRAQAHSLPLPSLLVITTRGAPDPLSPIALRLTREHGADLSLQISAARFDYGLDRRRDLRLKPRLFEDALGDLASQSLLQRLGELLSEHGRRRDQLAVAGHLAVEPRDELGRGHGVQLDAVTLQPVLPVVGHVIRDGLRASRALYIFDLESHVHRFFW